VLLFGSGWFISFIKFIRSKKGHQYFKDVREFLNDNRLELSEQAFRYYGDGELCQSLECEMEGGIVNAKILAKTEWIMREPLPLDEIELLLPDDNRLISGSYKVTNKYRYLWPYKGMFSRFPNYHDAIEAIDCPELWENRDSFAIASVESIESSLRLSFRMGKYFEYQDTGEALAFELARTQLLASKDGQHSYLDQQKLIRKLKLRRDIGNPADFSKRCAAVGIDTLIVFCANREPRFILHHRQAGKVALAPNMYTLVPAGEFQPAMPKETRSGSVTWSNIIKRDFDMWRNVMREANEEILGAPEIPYPDDYLDISPFRQLMDAKKKGELTIYFLGLALDPMSLKPDIMTVCVFKNDTFQETFQQIFQDSANLINAEGNLVVGRDNIGIPFDGAHLHPYLDGFTFYPTSKALLMLAFQHRSALGIKVND